jgi:hypothetical protein
LLSVVTTWCDRPELALTLPHNLAVLQAFRAEFEILIVNEGGNLAELSALVRQLGSSQLRLIDLPGQPFNKPEALNIGALCSTGDRIFMVDADILLTIEVLATVNELQLSGNFVTIRTVTESRPTASALRLRELIHTVEYVCHGGQRASIEYRVGADNSRSGPGLILVNKSDFISVGGFNSALGQWGFEDYDFQLRLQFALRLQRVTVCTLVHLSHRRYWEDSPDGKKSDSNRRNQAIAETNYSKRHFLGTYSEDLAKWEGRFVEIDLLASPLDQEHSCL